jgi:DUF1680 family protein
MAVKLAQNNSLNLRFLVFCADCLGIDRSDYRDSISQKRTINSVMETNLSYLSNRRIFLKQLGAAGIAAFPAKHLATLGGTTDGTEASGKALSVVKNRAPLAANAFYPLPLGSVRPTGWLRRQLQTQADGMGGHLDETWPDVGPNSGWLGGTGESWERGPYFLDGLVPLAYLLDDARLIAKAQKYIDWILQHQTSDGMIGPNSNNDWWPRMVVVKVLAQYQEVTGDQRVLPVLERYFAYQIQQLPNRPLRDWGKFRWHDEFLVVLWLYNRNGDPKLLDLARLLHQQGHDWQTQFADFQYTRPITSEFIKLNKGGNKDLELSTHGVNNAMGIKASPLLYLVSRSEGDRTALQRQLAALDRYHGLPNGMFSCDEHLAGLDPSQGSELCSVVEFMFSLEQSLAILGDPALGDRLERLAFNALPGTFTDDMWAHQYDQQPNQVECSLHRKPWTTNGPESNLFGLEPNFGCCTANFHQGWPKFAASLFMLSHDDGLVAAAYSPCEVRTLVQNTPLHVKEETEYPFRGTIRVTLNPVSPLRFALRLRIPAWASGATIQVNGTPEPPPEPNTFACVQRTWNAGDVVEIKFPLKPRASRWFNNSVAVERGPLVFSHGIGESWVKLGDRGMTADWQVFPTTAWNYAIAVSPENGADSVSVTEAPLGQRPFTAKPAPVELRVKARKVPSWRAEDGAANPVPPGPVSSDQPEESIALVPYAAAKLRITAFPQFKSEG